MRLYSAVLLLSQLFGCHVAPPQALIPIAGLWLPPGPASADAVPGGELEVPTFVALSNQSWILVDHPGRLIIQDSIQLIRAWAQIYDSGDPIPPPPAIDFSRFALIAVAAGGIQGDGRVLLDSLVREPQGALAVVWIEQGCAPIMGVDYPVLVVRIRQLSQSLRFVERRGPAPNCPTALQRNAP